MRLVAWGSIIFTNETLPASDTVTRKVARSAL